MKTFLKTLFWLFMIGLMVVTYQFRADVGKKITLIIDGAPCSKPITYSIGSFDTKFGISRSDFLKAISDAESVWEVALGKKLFQYSDSGKLKVNLIYDYRQKATQTLNSIGETIDSGKMTYDQMKLKYQAISSSFESEKITLENLKNTYTQHLKSYEDRVSYWNAQGGAPKNEYNNMQAVQTSINQEVAIINQQIVKVNNLADALNSSARTLNGLATDLNSKVKTANKISASTGPEFDEGTYVENQSGERIDIYQYDSRSKLVRVLAHELGHALGLDHVDDPKAIMYRLNEGSNITTTADDIAELKMVCGVK